MLLPVMCVIIRLIGKEGGRQGPSQRIVRHVKKFEPAASIQAG
jgi:hypothetical protein